MTTRAAAAASRARAAGLVVAAVLTATPGVHLFELILSPTPAKVVSHGLALVMLAIAFREWRVLRRRNNFRPRGLHDTDSDP